jgi:ribosomal protection tetracycline resistance protein
LSDRYESRLRAGRLGGFVETQTVGGDLSTIETVLPATRAHDLQRQLSGITGGEGVLESSFVGYLPVKDDPPSRRRATANPLNRDAYMTHLAHRRRG